MIILHTYKALHNYATGGSLFFHDFWRPPAAYFDPQFINFSNFLRDYTRSS